MTARIDTPEMAAAIVSRAYAETRAAQEAVSTETFPAIGGPAYGTGSGITVNLRGADVWVRRPAPKPGPVPPPAPLGAISARLVDAIPCPPPPVFDPRQYGPYFRAMGAATGTSTEYETDAAWRLAIEAGTGAQS